MSVGFQVAVCAVPFFDLLDGEEESLAVEVAEAPDAATAIAAMDASRQRLAQAVDSVVRSLPAAVRSDLTASRAVAYALVGLVDGRMLHRPAGGLERWRERLLEFELYGSALAGQEVVAQAQTAARGIAEGTPTLRIAAARGIAEGTPTLRTAAARGIAEGTPTLGHLAEGTPTLGHPSTLAPFYLAVLRAGFEGSLRGDAVGLASLIAALEEAVGAHKDGRLEAAPDLRPKRIGMAPVPLAALGLAAWLVAGFAAWFALFGRSFEEADQMAQRIAAGLPTTSVEDPLKHSVGPSGLATSTREES